MLIGVVGLGLIGGSMAKAINQNTDYSVYGYDIEDKITKKAILVGAIEGELTDEMIPECDLLFLGLYPQDTIEFLRTHASRIKKDCIVMDTGGVKQIVCDAAAPLAAGVLCQVPHAAQKSVFSGALSGASKRSIRSFIWQSRSGSCRHQLLSLMNMTVSSPIHHSWHTLSQVLMS